MVRLIFVLIIPNLVPINVKSVCRIKFFSGFMDLELRNGAKFLIEQ